MDGRFVDLTFAATYPGWPGFLGTRGSFMLDLVFLAMFAVVPVMAWSIWLVQRRRYELHRRVQLVLGTVLGLTVLAFEIDIRLHGWRERAIASTYWRDGGLNDAVDWSLIVHLCFAIPTPILWAFVIFRANKHFRHPIAPNAHSPAHRRYARLAAAGMVLTAVTGWVFYYLAFVA